MPEAKEKKQDVKSAAGGSRIGVVRNISGDKTIRVAIEKPIRHPIYGKYIGRRTLLCVHDPQQQAQAGDTVEIIPCRRISKNKSWRLLRVTRYSEMPAEK